MTLTAAVLAAAGSGFNLWWKFRDKKDKIRVACDLIYPQISPGYFLHVISLCDHPMRIADFGYVMLNGSLFSIPQFEVNEPDDEVRLAYGSIDLESRNASFETGMSLRDRPAGVYARTTSQSRPCLAFRYDTPKWQRLWLRVVIRWKIAYY
ncbi:hypothetical protein [Herbaspirillum sp. RV1423]|uniref:hypothetical protein n=1 Tax=Herbaspirillum sp. RV1423 TaxID=1443993 RepID=UPI00055844A7|nr:hypothetical protein [Herbaspirillum sp. RV1423]